MSLVKRLSQLAAVIALGVVVAGFSPAQQPADEETASAVCTDNRVTEQDRADTSRIACERIRATSGAPEKISIEELTSEGGFAEVYHRDGDIARIQGGLLTGMTRLRFDYALRDGELVCARETISNIQVSLEDEAENWESYWHHQHLVFADGEVVAATDEHTADAGDRGREVAEIRDFVDSVLSVAVEE